MILNLDFKYKNLENADIPGNTAAQVLAELLCGRTNNIGAIKAMDWAYKLHQNGSIEIDRADSVILEKFVIDSEILTNAGKAPIILAIRGLKSD